MKVHAVGQPVVVTMPLVDAVMGALSPTAISYTVVDDDGTVVQPQTTVTGFTSTTAKVVITVSAETNTLSEGTVGFRRVLLTVVTGAGTAVLQSDYLLEAANPFVVPSNSFMAYEGALVVARQVTPLDGWLAASAETRKFAMFRAFDQAKAFTYTMHYLDGTSESLTVDELTESKFWNLKTSQILDFKKAQLVQADYLLGGSPIEKDIQDGLQSSTIGEISQFYRPRPTLNLALCRAALGYVGKYIEWNIRAGRA